MTGDLLEPAKPRLVLLVLMAWGQRHADFGQRCSSLELPSVQNPISKQVNKPLRAGQATGGVRLGVGTSHGE